MADSSQPSILAVHLDGGNVVVVAQVPAGLVKVTLESRSRLGAGTWEPRSVVRLDGQAGEVTFQLPMSPNLELLRVRADATESLPVSFYQGTNVFGGAASSAPGPSATDLVPTVIGGIPGAPSDVSGGSSTATRDVVESDIWQISGNTLYFFNQYRGLQVIDISKPETPVLQGTLDLPAAGEQMYVLAPNLVALLASADCYSRSGMSESQVLLVQVTDGIPQVVSQLPVPGFIQESRLVGTALYVASGIYQPAGPTSSAQGTTGDVWEWGTQVSSFDLADPMQPVVRTTLWYPGSGNVVTATDRYLFVATPSLNNYQSLIRCIDISAPDGTMQALSTITPAGQVPDKFKMNVNGEIFATISQSWDANRRWLTSLETFSLANPAKPVKLGSLDLAQGEQLHATRFDGNRVYIVTFFQKDPLWVVDLSDPTKPGIVGELQVPGWSTYIHPLGDRLVTIGIDNSNSWRVAVSLFDVHDPAKPALVSKVPLGVNTSWSEANNDEKAFSVLPDSGLILVPYQGDFTNGYASRVQLIDLKLDDLTPNALVARGTIEHQFQPRRATVFLHNILSVSGKELLSVDATDRDHPVIQSTTELAWSANRLFLRGPYLIEVDNGTSWAWYVNSTAPPALRVALANDPAKIVGRFELTNSLAIAGATVTNGCLYVLQANTAYGGPILFDATGGTPDMTTNPVSAVLSVFDLSNLPVLNVAGVVSVTNAPLGGSLQAVWPKPGLLVWSGGGYAYGPLLYGVADGALLPSIYWGGGAGRLLAFDVTQSSVPQYLSEVNLTTNSWWNFSSAFTANGMVYLSHQASVFLEGVKPPYPPSPIVVFDPATGKYTTNQPPLGTWVQRYYLDVVDYADPQSPTMRKPVNIPGLLRGLSADGDLLYTVGSHWAADWTSDGSEWLEASAYDGVSASLVDSLQLPPVWPHPVLIQGTNIFIGRPDNSTNNLNSLEAWGLSKTGKFTRLGAHVSSVQASALAAFGNMLALADYYGAYRLLDVTAPAHLQLIGSGEVKGCVWLDGTQTLSQADGAIDRGLWLPLGDYGVEVIAVSPGLSPGP